jgi:uncharacterized SAM-binding protein YcdF (DUF218 family)
MFQISKILWGLFQPTSLILSGFIAAALFWIAGRAKIARRLFAGMVTLFLLCGFSPLSDWLLGSLEDRASAMAATNLDNASGIIVLGGGLERELQPDALLAVDKYGGRLAETVKLAQRFPALPVIFSGGIGDLIARQGAIPEAEHSRHYFERHGILPPRLVLEGRSRNTFENASLTAKLLQPKPGQSWILVTSAFHMPRAKALFEAQGFHILAYPVDYQANSPRRTRRSPASYFERFMRIDLAAKEWAGIAVYWLRGDISPF